MADGDHEVMVTEIGLTTGTKMDTNKMLHGRRVSKCYEFWKTICRDHTVLKHVGGVTIPFMQEIMCQTSCPPELQFSAKERQFVRETLHELVKTGYIVYLKKPRENGWCSNIFL